MMPLIENKKFIKPLLLGFLSLMVSLAEAWVTPVDMGADHEGSGNNTITTSLGSFDRCDTVLDGYTGSIPTQCHRRNLVWQLGSKSGDPVAAVPLAQWNPELGDDANWRLPTIKELSRLVDYSSVTGSGGALTGQPLIINMFPTEAAGFTPSNAWLISSTYRDIDGDAVNGQAQIFGINMGTGEIAAFDTVISDSQFGDTAIGPEHEFTTNSNDSYDVNEVYFESVTYDKENAEKVVVTKVVTSSSDNGDGIFTISGQDHTKKYPYSLEKCDSLNEDGSCNPSVADVYALLVHINTVSELITP